MSSELIRYNVVHKFVGAEEITWEYQADPNGHWLEADMALGRLAELEANFNALDTKYVRAVERIAQKWRDVDNVPAEYESKRVLICRQSSVQIGFMTTSYEWCDEHGKVLKDKPWGWQPLPEPLPAPPREGEQR